MDPADCSTNLQKDITVTPTEVIYQRRAAALAHAARTTITEAAGVFAVSRQTIHIWRKTAEQHGISALLPKTRRPPQQPNAMEPWEVEVILAEAIARPTLGAASLLEPLAERGVIRSRTGVQKILVRHKLGTRAQRVAVLAGITAADTGLLAPEVDPVGFCHFAGGPGDLVAVDAFYVGKLKGIGPVYQLTAIDTNTRWAVADLVIGRVNSTLTRDFIRLVRDRLAQVDIEMTGVLSDNGPEFIGKIFTGELAELGLTHVRIPPRSPNHNAVCERFQGTVLQEFYRAFFHRQRINDVASLNTALQSWLGRYNTRRRNHGDYMAGRTPQQMLTRWKDRQIV